MPVDLAYETSWPVYYRTFQTRSDETVVTTLACAPNPGDAAVVPEVTIIGRNRKGLVGNALMGSYTLVNGNAIVVSRTAFSLAQVYGTGGLGVAVGVVGVDLNLGCTGLLGVPVVWDVFWRMLELPLPKLPE